MNLKKRLVAVAIVGVFASLVSAACAQDKIDVSNLGQARAKQETLAWLAANKPTEPLVVSEDFFTTKFAHPYKFDKPAGPDPLIDPAVPGGASATLKAAGSTYKYHVSKMVRTALLQVAASDANKVFDVWINGENRRQFFAQLAKAPLNQTISTVHQLFLNDWEDVAMKAVELEKDDDAKTKKFQLALKQAAYLYTKVAVDLQDADEGVTGALPGVGSAVGSSSTSQTAAAGAAGTGGYSHSDVIHERLMSGIYRRHERRMNKIERITARR